MELIAFFFVLLLMVFFVLVMKNRFGRTRISAEYRNISEKRNPVPREMIAKVDVQVLNPDVRGQP